MRELGAEHLDWQAGRSPGPSYRGRDPAPAPAIAASGADARAPALLEGRARRAARAARPPCRRSSSRTAGRSTRSRARCGGRRSPGSARERAGPHAVVCVSETERRRGEAAGIRARWDVVPNGVDVRALLPASAEDRAAARASASSSPRARSSSASAGSAGPRARTSSSRHGRACSSGCRRRGSCSSAAGLTSRRSRRSGRRASIFAGERTDVPDWLAAADVVAAPSRWEGMSFAMLETMASARSLVITDVPGAQDALGEGAAGIVPLGDRQALASAIVTRLLDPGLAAEEGAAAPRAGRARPRPPRHDHGPRPTSTRRLLRLRCRPRGREAGGRAMRIDYLIRAHTAPEQLARLVERLDDGDVRFYVHVNRLTDDEIFEAMQRPARRPRATSSGSPASPAAGAASASWRRRSSGSRRSWRRRPPRPRAAALRPGLPAASRRAEIDALPRGAPRTELPPSLPPARRSSGRARAAGSTASATRTSSGSATGRGCCGCPIPPPLPAGLEPYGGIGALGALRPDARVAHRFVAERPERPELLPPHEDAGRDLLPDDPAELAARGDASTTSSSTTSTGAPAARTRRRSTAADLPQLRASGKLFARKFDAGRRLGDPRPARPGAGRVSLKTVILAGGFGTRLSEETTVRPEADGRDRRAPDPLAHHEALRGPRRATSS